MKAKTFYLIRHGQKESYQGDPELTELGRLQAYHTAEHLKAFPISKIVASPLKRTQQTAQAIAAALQLEYEMHPLLRERINWGDDPNQTWPNFIKTWIKSSVNREYVPPFGDSSLKAGLRVEKVIHELMMEKDQEMALVTHGGAISDFLRNGFEVHALEAQYPRFSFLYELGIKECSITQVRFDGKNYELECVASIEHLPSL